MKMSSDMKDLLAISWHDSAWIPIISSGNVLDYFTERSNPFYDRTCNNEIVKMQRLNPEQIRNMTGLEYILLHAQEPILYVIRKQHRHSPSQETPIADYYIIAGVVYLAPDLASVVNSRLLNTVSHLQASFEECLSFNRYHPSKGYWWDFKDTDDKVLKKEKKKEEPSSLFQRKRVDILLAELGKKFPLKVTEMRIQSSNPNQMPEENVPVDSSAPKNSNGENNSQSQQQITIKTERIDNFENNSNSSNSGQQQQQQQQAMRPPPEKKVKLM